MWHVGNIFSGEQRLHIFSKNTILQHNGHPHILQEAKKVKEKNVTDEGRKQIEAMSDAGIKPSQIASVMENCIRTWVIPIFNRSKCE